MNPYITILIILTTYLIGVFASIFSIRNYNSKLKFKWECIPPLFCLFSWFEILVIHVLDPIVTLIENIALKIDFSKIEKFFKYTNK